MNPLAFDFIINKENNTIRIIREFAAEKALVWRAWTEAELLDQWWGPEPCRAETQTLDFSVGGFWLYAMVGPEGEKHFAKVNFTGIETEKYFAGRGGFSDEKGNLNMDFPQNLWENTFSQKDNKTSVEMLLSYDSLADLETEIEMGFREGITQGLDQLDELLKKLQS